MEGFIVNLTKRLKSFEQVFTSRLTAARANNLDKLDATVSSRATQTTANSILQNTNQIEAKWDLYSPKIDDIQSRVIAKAPTSGSVLTVYNSTHITVAGKGLIRHIRKTGTTALRISLWVDGNLIYNNIYIDESTNIAEGGIIFKSNFWLYNNNTHGDSAPLCLYTKGDFT